MIKKQKLGFIRAISYVLDLLCYAYYCKSDNLVSDKTFDELEKMYKKISNNQYAPSRAMEREVCYSNGVKAVYDLIKKGSK